MNKCYFIFVVTFIHWSEAGDVGVGVTASIGVLSVDHHNVCILAILTEEEAPKYWVGV